jgi:hypothetical protein
MEPAQARANLAAFRPSTDINAKIFNDKVQRTFGQDFDNQSPNERLLAIGTLAQDAMRLLEDCQKGEKSRASLQERIEILETVDGGLSLALFRISNTKNVFEKIFNKSDEEKAAAKVLESVQNEVKAYKKLESELWNGQGLVNNLISVLVPGFMHQVASQAIDRKLKEEDVLLNLAACRLQGDTQFYGLKGVTPPLGFLSIVDDLQNLKIKFGHLFCVEGSQEKLNDLVDSLQTTKDIILRLMAIKLISEKVVDPANALGLEGTPFEAIGNREKNKELRILDIIYSIKSHVEKMRPGQEIILPLSGNTPKGSVTVQIAIGKNTSTNYYLRIIDTQGALLEKDSLGFKDLLQMATILAVNKANDLTFRDLSLDQVADYKMWKAIIEYNIRDRKAQQIAELFQPILNHYVGVLKKTAHTTHQHQITMNNNGEDSSVMAWIESKASPVLYDLIVLNRINVGLDIMQKLYPGSVYKILDKDHPDFNRQRDASQGIYQLLVAGKKQFDERYAKLKEILGKDYNPSNAQSEITRLNHANQKLAKDHSQLAAFASPQTDKERVQEVIDARLKFCVASDQSSKKPDDQLVIPAKSTLFKSEAEKKYEKWQKKQTEYKDYLQRKADIPKQCAAIQERIDLNNAQIKDLEKAGLRHADYQKVLEHLYNNYPFHDKAAVKVTVEGIDKADEWAVLNN